MSTLSTPTASALFMSYWLVISPLLFLYKGTWFMSGVGVMIIPAAWIEA